MPEIQLLVNPGFETGSLPPWISAGDVTVESSSSSDKAHTGTEFVKLTANMGSASISQFVLLPILPLSSLRLLFWMKIQEKKPTDITATVTPLGSLLPIITIEIPADSNPEKSKDDWLSYEGFSGPLPFGAPFGVVVTITVASGDDNEVDFDDIFLILDT
ncbi:hypothetical protein [Desulfoscipio geothermicus]|uniref:Uncharacterized protein n=1 Tax=Desulfoscipio geothermicus DSM 3669 TaxID=1121426 RepID=A0A1I6DZB0_9FIRM|nr:hypothetical protein [Desulfoscipio geothermicus]SFR10870.1 hypothetical protein SAMN05660706_1225 [Desulfoscipio geothermicus DSM 3669]